MLGCGAGAGRRRRHLDAAASTRAQSCVGSLLGWCVQLVVVHCSPIIVLLVLLLLVSALAFTVELVLTLGTVAIERHALPPVPCSHKRDQPPQTVCAPPRCLLAGSVASEGQAALGVLCSCANQRRGRYGDK